MLSYARRVYGIQRAECCKTFGIVNFELSRELNWPAEKSLISSVSFLEITDQDLAIESGLAWRRSGYDLSFVR
jgi:hypothetical protein